MKLDLRCPCGQVHHADTAHAGVAIRCRCGRALVIPTHRTPAFRPPRPRRRFRFRFRLPGLPARQENPAQPPKRISPVAVLAWGYLGAIVIYVALIWTAGDLWSIATLLLFRPRWPILLPAPLVALIVIFSRRPRLLIPIGLAALIAVGPGMGYRIGWRRWFSSSHSPQPRVRIVTFNVDTHENPSISAIPLGLLPYHPDALVFQECSPELTAPGAWPTGWTARFDAGLCLVTRFPVLEAKTLDGIKPGEWAGTGSIMLYRLQADSGPIDLAVIQLATPHSDPLGLVTGEEETSAPDLLRDIGSSRMRRWITKVSPGAIVAGDFEMPVESTIYRAAWGNCPNAFSTMGHGFGWTRVYGRYSMRLDHVLTCGPWQPVRAVVGPRLGSVHRPLIVDLMRVR